MIYTPAGTRKKEHHGLLTSGCKLATTFASQI